MEKTSPSRLTPRIWFVLTLLAITGQIAWAVENSWFNTFVYDMLTPDPRAVAWMVAVSAITATLTTLFMGTLSDRTRSRWGRRKPYILCRLHLVGPLDHRLPDGGLHPGHQHRRDRSGAG